MLIGMTSTGQKISEAHDYMAKNYGRVGVQFRLYLPPPKSQ